MMSWEESFQVVLNDSFVDAKHAAQLTEEKRQKQRNVKEEDKLFPADVIVSANLAAETIIKPWVYKNMPLINISDVVIEKEFGGYLFSGTYKGQKYLLEFTNIDDVANRIKTIIFLERINDALFPKVERYGITKGLSDMLDGDYFLVFYTYPGDLILPLFLNNDQTALLMYIFCSLLKKNIYLHSFTFYTTNDTGIWIQLNELFSIDDIKAYEYKNSLSYLFQYYYLQKETPTITKEYVRNNYIKQLSEYTEDLISDDVEKLFDCFEKTMF